jgi:hypothetical protein
VTSDPTYQPISADDAWFTGEDQNLQFTISSATGGVQDISGWAIQFKMAATKTGVAVLTKSATLTTPGSGICTVSSIASDTSGFTAGTYYYTLSRTDSGLNGVVAHGPVVLLGRPS